MASQSGLGMLAVLDQYHLSADIGSLEISSEIALLDVTGIDKHAYMRISGLNDAKMSFEGFFDSSAGQLHPVLASLPTANVLCTVAYGQTLGYVSSSISAKQVDYSLSRGTDGSLALTTELQGSGHVLDHGNLLTTGIQTFAGVGNGGGLDAGAASTSGLQAYLHVTAFTGTDMTVTLQESSDDGSGDPYANITGGGFTTATDVTSERIAVTGHLEQWLRIAVTGTFTTANLIVAVSRNP